MRKEVFVAIILGFIVGITIAFGVYNANQSLKKAKTVPSPLTTNETVTPSTKPKVTLVISEPEDNLVFRENEATVSGQTAPQATVAIMSEEDNELVLADEQGVFSTKVGLITGANEIKVVSLDSNGNKEEKSINVVYSTQKIE